MGEYLTIIWDAETPSAAAVPWDNCLLVVKASDASLTTSEVFACTADDWSTIMTNAGFGATSQGYESTSIFFSATPTPGCTLYVLALASGAITSYTDSPLLKIDSTNYETVIKPFLNFVGSEEVKYYPDATKTGYWINSADGSLGMSFTVGTDSFGNYTGDFTFSNGLSGNIIDSPPRVGSKVTVDFSVSKAIEDVSETIEDYKINMMTVAYPNDKTKTCFTSDCYYGNYVNDLSRFTNANAGKDCLLFLALPGNADPTASGCGLSSTWSNVKNIVGQREDITPIKIMPSSLNHDMGAGVMGMTAGTHPHTTMTFAVPHMGIQQAESKINRNYWNQGQVLSVMKKREISGEPYLITHGYTLGTGYSSRINYVRCKYIISQTLVNGLWALLASRKVRMSYNGMQLVKKTIAGIFKTLKDQGIVDGLAYVSIPVEIDLKNNTAAGQAARLAREIPSIEIGFYWYSSLEKITITGIRNEA